MPKLFKKFLWMIEIKNNQKKCFYKMFFYFTKIILYQLSKPLLIYPILSCLTITLE